jgi:hypothetical protein
VVAIEYATSLVPADGHGNTLGNSRAHHVAHGRPSQVVENQADILQVVAFPFVRTRMTVALVRHSLFAMRANHFSETGRAAELRPRAAEVCNTRAIVASEHVMIRALAVDAMATIPPWRLQSSEIPPQTLESKISSPLSHPRKTSKPTLLAQTGTQ